MSIRDYYLICNDCEKRVFVTADRVSGYDSVNGEVAEFVVEHFNHDVKLGDEESTPNDKDPYFWGE